MSKTEVYKLFMGALSTILMDNVQSKDLLPPEQSTLRKGRRGCLDALAVDESLAREARVFKRDLSVVWVDY